MFSYAKVKLGEANLTVRGAVAQEGQLTHGKMINVSGGRHAKEFTLIITYYLCVTTCHAMQNKYAQF